MQPRPCLAGLAEDVPLFDEAALAGGDVLPPLSMSGATDGATARVRSARAIGDGANTAQQRPKRRSGGARKYKSGPLERFCEVKGSLYFLDKVRAGGRTRGAAASEAVCGGASLEGCRSRDCALHT